MAINLTKRANYANLQRHPLVVCAALVQNPANLGALCRTAEAFRLELLVVASLGVVQEQSFRNLAASAHQWQPIASCALDELPARIQEWRSAGYGIVALQQSAGATPIFDVIYPQRCVLVLGRELTGVPGEIEELCDRAIAIPQDGLVDSLNVQTAAAIAIYEYLRQSAGERGGSGR